MTELHTERLFLRPMLKSDAEQVFSYRADSETNKYQGWIPKTIADVHSFIESRVSPILNIQGTWFQFVVLKTENNEIIGDVGLHFFDRENKQVELGCTIDKKYQKLGFATEAMSEVMHFLFLELNKHRIITSIDPRNVASINLGTKLGMRQEAHFKESIRQNGVWVDDLIYAILRSEWEEQQR